MPGLERAFTEPFTIGRGMQATLHVDSGRVSRIHAEVVFEGGGWVLRDAGSTNGTYLNGRRVTAPTDLRRGDAVQVGKTVIAISHDMEFVAEQFARTVVLDGGKVAADGATLAVLAELGEESLVVGQPPQLLRLAQQLGIRLEGAGVADFMEADRLWRTERR